MNKDIKQHTAMSPPKAKRLLELDVFRGIAALFVVLFHYTVRYGQIYGHLKEPPVKISYGHYGVHLFFIISGFVIFLTLERTKNPLDFVVSRISRLYPAYWAAIVVTFLLVSFFGLPGREVSPGHAVLNLTMLQSWFNVPSVDGVYWTLAIELKFYLIMFCLFVTNNLKRINIAASIWLGLIIIDILLYKFFQIRLIGPLRTFLIFEHGSLFIAGIFFYKLKFGERGVMLHVLIWTGLFAIFIADGIEKTLVVLLYYILFYLFVYGHLSLLARKSLIFLGTISYTLYLVHQNIGYIIINAYYKYFENPAAAILLALAGSLSIATMITYAVEKPMLKIIRSYYKKNRSRYIEIPIYFSKLWNSLAAKR
jgi:peptidoglycan/LPS O-acetylase OafA/YrhL